MKIFARNIRDINLPRGAGVRKNMKTRLATRDELRFTNKSTEANFATGRYKSEGKHTGKIQYAKKMERERTSRRESTEIAALASPFSFFFLI